MASIYEDGTYLRNNPTWGIKDSSWKAEQVMKMMKAHGIKPSTICEIGCGAGGILNHLSRRLPDDISISGYDISPQAIALCRSEEHKDIHFYCADLLQEVGTYFDIVLAMDVIEHIEDYFGFLRKLKERGHFKIFHIPLDIFALSILRGNDFANGRNTVGHIHYFVKETALATLRDTGYEIIDCYYTRPSIELPQQQLSAVLLNLPRRVLFSIHQDFTARVLGGFP